MTFSDREPDAKLLEAIGELVNSETWLEAQQIVDTRPVLLDDRVDFAFEWLLEQYRNDEDITRTLMEHHELLRSCREEGVEQTFADKLLSVSWLIRLRQSAEERGAAAIGAFEALPVRVRRQLASSHTLKQLAQLADEHAELRSYLRMIDRQHTRELAVVEALAELDEARSLDETRQAIEAHPELLFGECDVLLTRIIEQEEDTDMARHYAQLRDLLRRCRDAGVDVALPQEIGGRLDHSALPAEILDIMQSKGPEWESRRRAIEFLLEHPEVIQDVENSLSQDPFIAAVLALTEAESDEVLYSATHFLEVVAAHPILLSREADESILATMAIAPPEEEQPAAIQLMEGWRRILRCLRGLGIPADQIAVLAEAAKQGLLDDERFLRASYEHPEFRIAIAVGDLLDSPLPVLSCRVLDGDLSLQGALAEATRESTVRQLDPADINILNVYIFDLLDRYPTAARVAHVLAELNTAVAEHFGEPRAIARALTTLRLSLTKLIHRYPHAESNLDLAEKQIEVSRRVVAIWQKLENEKQRAKALLGLGESYQSTRYGNREQNLRKARDCYLEATIHVTSQAAPTTYAGIQSNLGHIHSELLEGNREDNLQRAISFYLEALGHISAETDAVLYIAIQNGLGNAYSQLPIARDENLQRAISCYRRSLRHCNRSELPREFAMTQINLGLAYENLPSGGMQDNLERAIDCFQLAVSVCTQEQLPELYAMAQANLGSAYGQYAKGDREYNLGRALFCYEAASRVYSRKLYTLEHARLQGNVGVVLTELARLTGKTEYLDRAIASLNEALSEYTQQDARLQCARVGSSLGYAYSMRGELADHPEDAHLAVRYLTEALNTLTPQVAPLECHKAATNLGNLHLEQGDRLGWTQKQRWEYAYDAYVLALDAADVLYRSGWTAQGKGAEQRGIAAASRRLVTVCLNLIEVSPDRAHVWQQEALVRLEQGKARQFLDQLAQAEYPTPSAIPPDLLEREQAVLVQLRTLEKSETSLRQATSTESRNRQDSAKIIEERDRIHSQLRDVWTEMLRFGPAASEYVALRRGEPLGWDDLAALMHGLGPQAAMVALYTLAEKVVVFVLRSDWSSPRVYSVPLTKVEFYFRYALNYQDEIINWPRCRQAGRRMTSAWRKLGERIFRPLWHDLAEDMSGTELLYLIPHGNLHFLPLHALTVDGKALLDRWAVAYAPSAGVLARVLKRGKDKRQGALVMGYTSADPNSEEGHRERELFVGEAIGIARHFGVHPWLDREATLAKLENEGLVSSVIHLSCHGTFELKNPLASGIELADGPVTVLEWMGLGLEADLITLSACQTGISDVEAGDELIGLTRGLIYAGASSALVTLWSVDARTTRDLMLDFYRKGWSTNQHKRMGKAYAIREAMLELQSRHPDPYYWAPFVLVGDWW